MRKHPHFSRPRLIERLRRRLERDGHPRLQMSLLVAITATAGFLAAALLLRLGVVSMALRYFLACAVAYLVFLGLLWAWMRTRADDYADAVDLPSPARGGGEGFEGNGGSSAGGGSSASFEVDDSAGADASRAFGKSLDLGDADEFTIPVFLVAVLLAMLVSAFFVVWSAPVLIAELLVDGVLAASLYRRLRGLETRYWLTTAVRRTYLPFLATALIVSAAGWCVQHASPRATSIGDAIEDAAS